MTQSKKIFPVLEALDELTKAAYCGTISASKSMFLVDTVRDYMDEQNLLIEKLVDALRLANRYTFPPNPTGIDVIDTMRDQNYLMASQAIDEALSSTKEETDET